MHLTLLDAKKMCLKPDIWVDTNWLSLLGKCVRGHDGCILWTSVYSMLYTFV